jgi:DNA-binding response OmpR family regulator
MMEESTNNNPAQIPFTVLVIDDERSILKAVSIMLKEEGYVVFDTDDPFYAATMFTSRRIDAAILDVCLSGIDGVQFAEWIRTISPATAVLLMSAHTDSPLTKKAREQFGENFLDKSRLHETLITRVNAVLGRIPASG